MAAVITTSLFISQAASAGPTAQQIIVRVQTAAKSDTALVKAALADAFATHMAEKADPAKILEIVRQTIAGVPEENIPQVAEVAVAVLPKDTGRIVRAAVAASTKMQTVDEIVGAAMKMAKSVSYGTPETTTAIAQGAALGARDRKEAGKPIHE